MKLNISQYILNKTFIRLRLGQIRFVWEIGLFHEAIFEVCLVQFWEIRLFHKVIFEICLVKFWEIRLFYKVIFETCLKQFLEIWLRRHQVSIFNAILIQTWHHDNIKTIKITIFFGRSFLFKKERLQFWEIRSFHKAVFEICLYSFEKLCVYFGNAKSK